MILLNYCRMHFIFLVMLMPLTDGEMLRCPCSVSVMTPTIYLAYCFDCLKIIHITNYNDFSLADCNIALMPIHFAKLNYRYSVAGVNFCVNKLSSIQFFFQVTYSTSCSSPVHLLFLLFGCIILVLTRAAEVLCQHSFMTKFLL
jgi:hypothetical protein